MLNPELSQRKFILKKEPVVCLQCERPIDIGFPQLILDECEKNPEIYIPLICHFCNLTFTFFPATGVLFNNSLNKSVDFDILKKVE